METTRERVSGSKARGRGWFLAGALAMIAVGLMHVAAHVQTRPEGTEAAHAAMVAFTVTAFEMTWSISDAYDVSSLSFAVLSMLVGALALYALRAFAPQAAGLRGFALVNAIGLAVVVAIAAAYRVGPPLVLYLIVLVLFAVAALRSVRSRADAPSVP